MSFKKWIGLVQFYIITNLKDSNDRMVLFCPWWYFQDWLKGLPPEHAAEKVTNIFDTKSK